jgi:DNA-binding NtrC family response regulator
MPAPVIIVHNEPDIREQALSALITAGVEAAAFDDPLAALDAIEAASRVRVLVTRVNFGPGHLNGVALANMVKFNLGRGIKAVFIARKEHQAHTEGVGECLVSPLDPLALVDAVTRLIGLEPASR